jgi:multimeric flavodoxin WrbA
MKKITAFVGCFSKRNTHRAVLQFLGMLQAQGDVECEIVPLGDYRIETCRGCCVCFERGEEFCPLRDDRDLLIKKIEDSDGVVFATPNYSFQVSGLMKVFLDRLGFAFHRPRFHGIAFTSIVTQGIFGGGKIVKYLDFAAGGLGFNVVKGSLLQTLEPVTEKARKKIEGTLAAQSRRFHERLARPAFPAPSLFGLLLFRIFRTSMKVMLDARSRDWRFYSDKGWLESDFYYPVRLGALKKAAGALFDSLGGRIAKGRQA